MNLMKYMQQKHMALILLYGNDANNARWWLIVAPTLIGPVFAPGLNAMYDQVMGIR